MNTYLMITGQGIKSIVGKPGRTLATATGVALGVMVFLTTLGWASTVNSMVNADFDATLATRIVLTDNSQLGPDPLDRNDFDSQVGDLAGVVAAGKYTTVDFLPVRGTPMKNDIDLPVIVASPGIWEATEATIFHGRFFDTSSTESGHAQVVLGAAAARQLGIDHLSVPLTVLIDQVPVTVMGILNAPGSQPELGLGLVIPEATLESLGRDITDRWIGIVRTELGAAPEVARALPFAVSPNSPKQIGLQLPPSPESLRGDVQDSLNNMALGAASLALLVGAVGIMNAMLTAVHQRTSEIGLRRALGARGRQIVYQFLMEGTVIGSVGGILGAVSAAGLLIVIAMANNVVPVADRWLFLVAPVAGTLIGALAGIYPAIRAARVSPAASLRR